MNNCGSVCYIRRCPICLIFILYNIRMKLYIAKSDFMGIDEGTVMYIRNGQSYSIWFPSSYWHEDIILKTGLFNEVDIDLPQEIMQILSDMDIKNDNVLYYMAHYMYHIISKNTVGAIWCLKKDGCCKSLNKGVLRFHYEPKERYPFDKLQVNQFFELPLEKYNSACSSASAFSKNNPRKVFSVTKCIGNYETVVKVTRVR